MVRQFTVVDSVPAEHRELGVERTTCKIRQSSPQVDRPLYQLDLSDNQISHATPVGGKFPPITQEAPGTLVLTFRCHPTIQPYLPGDENANPTVLVYSDVSDTIRYPDSQPYSPPAGWPGPMKPEDMHDLTVTVTVDGTVVATGQLPAVPATGPDNVTEGLKVSVSRHEVPLALGHLRPRNVHYHMECSARTQDGQTFTSSSKLSYLPNPPSGSVTKRDLRTGALLARGPNGSEDFAPIFPIGFYTQFDEYLTGPNRALVLSELKDEGYVLRTRTSTQL